MSDSLNTITQLLKNKLMQDLPGTDFLDKIDGTNLRKIAGDLPVLDSLSNKILLQIRQLTTHIGAAGSKLVNDGGRISKDALQERIVSLLQTQQIESLIKSFAGIVKQPLLHWNTGEFQINGHQTTPLMGIGNGLMNRTAITGDWTVLSIPVNMQVIRQDMTGLQSNSHCNISFQFGREAYLHSLRDKLALRIKRENFLNYNQGLKSLGERMLTALKSSVSSIDSSYKSMINQILKQFSNPADLLAMDETAMKETLEELLTMPKTEEGKLISVSGTTAQHLLQTSMSDSLIDGLSDKEHIDKIISLLNSVKTRLHAKDIINQLQDSLNVREYHLEESLSDPGTLKTMIKDELGLVGLQKLFLNISQLQIGLHTICLSPLSVNQYLINGMSVAFYNKNKFLFVMAGKQAGLNTGFGNQAEYSMLPMSNNTIGISFGKGERGRDHTHIGIFNYQCGKNNNPNGLIAAVPGHTIVTTADNQFSLGQTGKLLMEVSRSTHSYNNQPLSDTVLSGINTVKPLSSNGNLFDQMAFTLQWTGTNEAKQLNYDIHFAKTGQAYMNPGNMFITTGLTELGGSFRKSIFQRKLQLSAKLNYRDYQFSSVNSKWINYNFSFLAKWKLNKGQFVAVRYQPYVATRVQDINKYTAATNSRFSLEGSFRRRFGRINYQHSLTLAYVRSTATLDTIPITNGVDLSSMQTFTVNKLCYYLNTQYSRANKVSGPLFFNTQFNTEAGCVYKIDKRFSSSTAIYYNSMQHHYRQAGIKQSISGQIGDRFTVTLYGDLQKQLETYTPYSIGNTALNWSLQYVLK